MGVIALRVRVPPSPPIEKIKKNREKEDEKMEVLSIRKQKDGGYKMSLELTPAEENVLFVAGLRLELAEMGCKSVVVPIKEAEAMGLKMKKGAKSIEMTKEDSRLLVEKAVNDCLRKKVAEEKAKRAKAKRKK